MTLRFASVPTVATGDIWSASNHNTFVRDNFAVGANGLTGAKGDIVAGYDLQDGVRLSVGINWSNLVADSRETSGLKWATSGFGASAYNIGSQSISVDQIVQMELPAVITDPESLFDVTNDYFTVPAGMAGFWQVVITGYMVGVPADAGKLMQLGCAIDSHTNFPMYRWNSTVLNVDNRPVWLNYTSVLALGAGWNVWGVAYHQCADARPLSLGRMALTKVR
jgi:hypothetical protein